jgi:thioredoxin reductase (NADPH)
VNDRYLSLVKTGLEGRQAPRPPRSGGAAASHSFVNVAVPIERASVRRRALTDHPTGFPRYQLLYWCIQSGVRETVNYSETLLLRRFGSLTWTSIRPGNNSYLGIRVFRRPNAHMSDEQGARNGSLANGSALPLVTPLCVIGSGPAGHTAAIYAARAQLRPIMFEGMLANGIAAGGQLTTTTDVENYPGFPEGISGFELMDRFRKQSQVHGTKILTETVESVDLQSRPFRIYSSQHVVLAASVIIATGAVAKRMDFPGAGSGEGGFWQRGISACAVCDGAAPIFRGKPIAVVGGGDTALEEALFLTRYASRVYVIHRRDTLRASKIMQKRAFENQKIEFLWNSIVVAAHGDTLLRRITLQSTKDDQKHELEVGGLFFAIGHVPATAFLKGQLLLDDQGYIITKPGTTQTSVDGVFAAGDVQDKRYRQAVTAAGSGCMAAMDAEHWLQEHEEEVLALERIPESRQCQTESV